MFYISLIEEDILLIKDELLKMKKYDEMTGEWIEQMENRIDRLYFKSLDNE